MGQSEKSTRREPWPPLWLATLVAVVVSMLAVFVVVS